MMTTSSGTVSRINNAKFDPRKMDAVEKTVDELDKEVF